SRYRSTRQPATISFFACPSLCRAISRIVLTDSCCALSMKEQVLTTMTSASSAEATRSAPACESTPIITSLSTRFLGQPRLTNPTLGETFGGSAAATDEAFDCMQSLDFSIAARITFAAGERGTEQRKTEIRCPGGLSPMASLVFRIAAIEFAHEF